jgi:tellurite resistance protein TerC
MEYLVLLAVLGAFLFVDLAWINRSHDIEQQNRPIKAMIWTGVCAASAIAFGMALIPAYNNGWIETRVGSQLSGSDAALQFLTAWLVEQSLSLDNVFVMAVILNFFKVPLAQHHRVLMLGILGAIVMRGICIFLGAALIQQFDWMNYIFSALLLLAAYKLWKLEEGEFDPSASPAYRLATRFLPLSERFDGGRFTTREAGRFVFTRLFVVLILIEFTDLMFAFDSIPAVFAISSDPFIVFASNMFAILNLRSLYSVLSVLLERFSGLKYGLIGVLAFIGLKMAVHDFVHIPTALSSLIILSLLIFGLVKKTPTAAK